jgi:hypothetical protein
MQDMTDLDTILITAHRGNRRRYRRLLRTHLTELERSFVLRRLDEETAALSDLLRKRATRHLQAVPDHLPAAACSGGDPGLFHGAPENITRQEQRPW